jgi:putative ABC transport system substrate-binding protein
MPAPALQATTVVKPLGLRLQSVGVKGPDDFESAFKTAKSGGAEALIVISNPLSNTHGARIVDLAAKNRLPGIYPSTDFVEDRGLMSYGADILDNWRRAATYVDKILKGANPSDLLIVKILSHLGLPTRGPPRAPARRVDLFQTI